MMDPNDSQEAFQGFLQRCAEEFMTLPKNRTPELHLQTNRELIKIHVLEATPAALDFFQTIMRCEPDRFKTLNRAFSQAQPELAGVGWVVTRFAGVVYLSLCLGDEIYVRRIPAEISAQAIDLARTFNRFLDCAIATGSPTRESSAMPVALAYSLLDQTAKQQSRVEKARSSTFCYHPTERSDSPSVAGQT